MVDGLFQIVIEKLEEKNFQMWKTFVNFFMNKDYWDFIIGEIRIYFPKKFYNIINSS
jgi:hypothetical protein